MRANLEAKIAVGLGRMLAADLPGPARGARSFSACRFRDDLAHRTLVSIEPGKAALQRLLRIGGKLRTVLECRAQPCENFGRGLALTIGGVIIAERPEKPGKFPAIGDRHDRHSAGESRDAGMHARASEEIQPR